MKKQAAQRAQRRNFVKAATGVGAGLLIVPSAVAFGSVANSSLGLGIIGCGGRGNEVGGQFVNHTETRVAALMDLFDDRLGSTRERFDRMAEEKGSTKLSSASIFKGLKAYEKLVQAKDVDVVLVTSPPWFHPDHFEAALAAGKHVYLEKPVATDVHGCKRISKAGRQYDGKVSIHVGFQKRYAEPYRRMVEKIHNGDLGEIVLGQTFYYTNDLDRQAKPGMSETEARIRNWVFDKALSGDILVEQNIHIVDCTNWVLKAHPVSAMGTGGRRVRKDVGDVWDHYIMTFIYPNDVKISFNSNQFKNKGYRDSGERYFGTKGASESHQGGPVFISFNNGEKWDSGATSAMATSVADKVKAFVAGIKASQFDNQSEQGAESTLSVILGRTAAYSGKEITWDKLLRSDAKWDVKLNGDLA